MNPPAVVSFGEAEVNAVRAALDNELNAARTKLHTTYRLVFEAKVALHTAYLHYQSGDLLGAARSIALACRLEYRALGACEHTGALFEVIHVAHVGSSDAETCGTSACEVCAALNATGPGRLPL